MDVIINNIFNFSYPVAFLGAIFFSIGSIVNINFLSILFNKNIDVFVSVYVGLCGYISLYVYYNQQLILFNTYLDNAIIYKSFNDNNQTVTDEGGNYGHNAFVKRRVRT